MDNGRMQFKVQNANCKRQGGGDGHNHGWTVTGCNSKCKMQTAKGKMAKTGVKEPRIQGVEWRGIEGQGNRTEDEGRSAKGRLEARSLSENSEIV
jgi:hypothetical protein